MFNVAFWRFLNYEINLSRKAYSWEGPTLSWKKDNNGLWVWLGRYELIISRRPTAAKKGSNGTVRDIREEGGKRAA